MSESLQIEVPTAASAVGLVDRLDGFPVELVTLSDDRFQVQIDLGQDGQRTILDVISRVEDWLESTNILLADIRLDGRSYRLERPNGLALLPSVRPSELEGLVCQVKAIPLGAGVQVVSVEGELDLQTAPELEQILRTTDLPCVIVDLTEVPFLDSTALGVLLAATRKMEKNGRRLLVAAGSPAVARTLTISGLARTLDVHDSLAEAITAALDHVVISDGH